VPTDHVIDASLIHHQWDSELEPILAVNSGDTVHYDLKVAGDGQVWPGARYSGTRFDFDTIYRARFRRDSFNWFLNGFVPVAGIGIDGYILYKGFFVTELALPFKTGGGIVWFSLAWAVIGIFWALWWSRRKRLASISLASEV
jgi:hypothetical protein